MESGAGARELDYETALALLRNALVAVSANARAFATQAGRGAQSEVLSARSWRELGQIEALLAARIEATLQREMRAEPWSLPGRTRAFWRGLRDGFSGEQTLARRQLEEARALPVADWRAGAPQLEALWPFFEKRTQHLANALALGLNEPAPFAALIWRADQREFRGQEPG